MPRPGLSAASALIAAALPAVPLDAQLDTLRIDPYHYALDVDVPESAALVALGEAPLHVLRAGAPKPLYAAVLDARGGGRSRRGAAVDFSPYYLAGGRRTLASYRDMSLWGRTMRVLTKTLVSFAAVEDAEHADATGVAVGVRSTLHDPHDPIGNTRLVEDVAAAPAGTDLRPLYAAARRQVRARCCVQVAGGWGMAGRIEGGAAEHVRHTVWVGAQLTLGDRVDLLGTLQGRSVFHPDAALRAGGAVQLKGEAADLFGELAFDSDDHRLHPGVGVEVRPLPRMGLVAAVVSDPPPAGGGGRATVRFRTLLRWYLARPG